MKQRVAGDIIIPIYGTLKAGSIIDNTSSDASKVTFKDKDGGVITFSKTLGGMKLDNVPDSTPVRINIEKTQLAKDIEGGIESAAKNIKLAGTLGFIGGLGFAHYRKSGVGGYIGYAILFASVLGIGTSVYYGRKAMKGIEGAIKPSESKPNNTNELEIKPKIVRGSQPNERTL